MNAATLYRTIEAARKAQPDDSHMAVGVPVGVVFELDGVQHEIRRADVQVAVDGHVLLVLQGLPKSGEKQAA